MYRNSFQTHTGFNSQSTQNQFRYTSSSGFGQRPPLYPIGPTLTQPEFKPMARPMSPSPYLHNREGIRPPSYEERFLKKAESMAGQNNISYEEREKRLIERNEREIQEQQKRREQIRSSYERQINTLSAKLNRNMESKQKLLTEIQSLQISHDDLHEKLMTMQPPEKNRDTFEPIDRKQQEMIILKNKLINSMRENETELYKKQEEEEKYWEDQIASKEKILFKLEQDMRDKRLELHMEKQKTLERPDFMSLEEEVRATCYDDFLHKYEQLEKKVKNLTEQRQKSAKLVRDTLEIKKPQLHNLNVRRAEIKREHTNLKLRVEELNRVSKEMEAANQNLMKELDRKDEMIGKYELDIHDLRSLKESTESQIAGILNQAREKEEDTIFGALSTVITKAQQDIRFEQACTSKLKNQYQKLYELLCSATSKNIHMTFSQTLVSS